MANDQERAAFEAWARRARGFSDRYLAQQPDGYENEVVEASWVGWQAGRAALAAAPVTCQTYGPGTAVPCAECNQTLVDSQELAELRARVAAPQVPAAPQWPSQPADAGLMPLIEDYAKAVHDGDDDLCAVLRETIAASLPAAPGAPQPAEQAPLDVCTDPYNCKRCAAPQWDKHKFEHAGLTSAAGVKEPANASK